MDKPEHMIVITGSTGHLGTLVIDFLLGKGTAPGNITGVARDIRKAEEHKKKGINIASADYDDYDSLLWAFKDAEKLLFISGNEVEKRDKQHENIIKAASATGVKHIIYTSFARKSEVTGSPVAFIADAHIETENKIRTAGIVYTFLRNALYAEGIPMFIGKDVTERGIFFPAGNGRVPFASRVDIAEATANVLTGANHENKAYNTVHTHNFSFYEIAGIISDLTGRDVKYFCPPADEFKSALKNKGVPETVIENILAWANGINQGYFESEHSDLPYLLGRNPADLRTVLAGFYPARAHI